MSRKIFRSTLAIAAAVLIASLVIVLGCLYDYFSKVQANQLKDELRLAACAVEESGQAYLSTMRAEDFCSRRSQKVSVPTVNSISNDKHT